MWHLRWLVRTRADISQRPSGLVSPRTDSKLQPGPLARTGTDIKLGPIGLVRSYIKGLIQEQIYVHVDLFKLSLGHFFKFQ